MIRCTPKLLRPGPNHCTIYFSTLILGELVMTGQRLAAANGACCWGSLISTTASLPLCPSRISRKLKLLTFSRYSSLPFTSSSFLNPSPFFRGFSRLSKGLWFVLGFAGPVKMKVFLFQIPFQQRVLPYFKYLKKDCFFL